MPENRSVIQRNPFLTIRRSQIDRAANGIIVSKRYQSRQIAASVKNDLFPSCHKLFDALNSPDVSNEDFKQSISSERLYPLFGIARQANPRGRPRKVKGGDGT